MARWRDEMERRDGRRDKGAGRQGNTKGRGESEKDAGARRRGQTKGQGEGQDDRVWLLTLVIRVRVRDVHLYFSMDCSPTRERR